MAAVREEPLCVYFMQSHSQLHLVFFLAFLVWIFQSLMPAGYFLILRLLVHILCRVRLVVEEVKVDSFLLSVVTWGDTVVNSVNVAWIAIDAALEISSGGCVKVIGNVENTFSTLTEWGYSVFQKG